MGTVNHFQAALGRYFGLALRDRQLLQGLAHLPSSAGKNRVLWALDARVDELFILYSGWACTIRDTCEGERQIIELLLPGDIVGLREFTFRRHGSEARMISSGSVCAFSHQDIVDLVESSTPLAIALFATIGRQEALLTERMLVTLHRPARVQVCHFVMETFQRLSKVQAVDPGHMPFPISQRLLGQILGLSPVHISRTLMALERDRVFEKHSGHLVILDTERLRHEADFNDDYLSDQMDGLGERLTQLGLVGTSADISRSDG